MAGGYTVPMDPELARRKTKPDEDIAEEKLTTEAAAERQEVEAIMNTRKRYGQDRKGKELEWVECFKMYMSWVDRVINPFLSNLFIPKTHEAVELLAAFMIGSNQTISATPEKGAENTMKAQVAGKYLDYLWRKVLKARIKTLVWIKQGIVFGNGIMKVGYDPVAKKPWMAVCAIEDVYFDYYVPDMQDSEYIFHEIRRDPSDVKDDLKYDLKDENGVFMREQCIVGGESFVNEALFSTFDASFNRSENRGKVLVVEAWCKNKNKLKTLLPTKNGWRIARNSENPNKYHNGDNFRPFGKLRFKTSALPNRAYDTGGVWPTVGIQKSFNDLMREYFDSVVMVNAPMWVKRRGARINPMELVRRPGGVITVGDINKDLKTDQIGDVKQSMIEMLNRLDREFQSASMISGLLQQFSDTATGDSLEQAPLQALRDMINQNIVDALSEIGQMVLAISLQNSTGKETVVMWENEKETASLEFDPSEIDGMHDVLIIPDRKELTNSASQAKAMTNFLGLIANDLGIQQQYPSLKTKVYKRFLENDGVNDADYFFQEENPAKQSIPVLGPDGKPMIPALPAPQPVVQ